MGATIDPLSILRMRVENVGGMVRLTRIEDQSHQSYSDWVKKIQDIPRVSQKLLKVGVTKALECSIPFVLLRTTMIWSCLFRRWKE